MKILISPQIAKKIVNNENFSYKINYGTTNEHVYKFVPEEQVTDIRVTTSIEGRERVASFPPKEFVIHIIGEEDEIQDND